MAFQRALCKTVQAGGCLFPEVSQRDANEVESLKWDPGWQNSNHSKVSSHHILWTPPMSMHIMTSLPFTFSYIDVEPLATNVYMNGYICRYVYTHTHTQQQCRHAEAKAHYWKAREQGYSTIQHLCTFAQHFFTFNDLICKVEGHSQDIIEKIGSYSKVPS